MRGSCARYTIRIQAFLCIFFFILAFISADQQIDISQYQRKMKEIALQIERIKNILTEETQRETSILAQLDQIGLKKELARKEIAMYNTQLQKATSELSDLQERIIILQSKLDNGKQSISKIVVTLYKFGELNYLDMLFQVKDIKSLVAENKNLTLLAKTQEKILYDYIATMDELKEAEKGLQSKKQEITRLLASTKDKRLELANKEQKSRSLINKIKQDKQIHKQRLEELNERHKDLQNLLKRILTQESVFPFIPSPLYEKKGKLDWPIPGSIISRFGTKHHPRFKTRTQNNGIEISPHTDLVVKAVHPASVVYSDYFRGYGNLIILDHGMKYYTLYGHCADLLVKKGDFVDAGQAIAYVGDIGSLEGKTLYFSIRFRDKFLNPLQWLKRR
jgi:septal ring factor EnvC (AmiA/AmiB activator)